MRSTKATQQLSGIVLVLAALWLGGCGFHLRGSLALPSELKQLFLFGSSAALKDEIKNMLRVSDGKIVASPNEAGVVVKVLKEDLRRRVLSVGSTGKSSEVELNYYLRFQFYDNQEAPLLDEQTLEISRDYFNDQTALLAKDNEELVIKKEIYRQAARMLMLRAQAAVDSIKR
ncbi:MULTISPECIES: LPS-assembly lipoprotein LptE [Methylomonas]|uniref:LPS-assembly lipoprotein LptE n=1 Tax=Methylomonas TaxID=416 RepID=UPI001232D14E|nr:LPS assembly lipoprotein LptE [Methylomonas rhizoryzae]